MRTLLRSWRHQVRQARREHAIKNSQPFTPIQPLPKIEPEARPQEAHRYSGDRAFTLLEKQCSFGPRIPGQEGHKRTRQFLIEELGLWTDEVAVQEWHQEIASGAFKGQTVPLTNIFARINCAAQPEVMLCAHWDTRPVADQDSNEELRNSPVPGANDGASGVAVLLEVARVLHTQKPEMGVVFGLFDGEDLGAYYYGSRMFARYCHRPELTPWRAKHAILLDMVGKKNLRCNTELHSTKLAPHLWGEFHESAAKLGLEPHFLGPERQVNDDHVFLNAAEIPSILLIDYAYPQWHTTEDTVDKCCPESLQIMGDVLCDYLYSQGSRSGNSAC